MFKDVKNKKNFLSPFAGMPRAWGGGVQSAFALFVTVCLKSRSSPQSVTIGTKPVLVAHINTKLYNLKMESVGLESFSRIKSLRDIKAMSALHRATRGDEEKQAVQAAWQNQNLEEKMCCNLPKEQVKNATCFKKMLCTGSAWRYV